MPVDETCRRRKPAFKAFFPWPGFFLLDQHLPDRLLGLQAEGFCPLQIAGQGPGACRLIQLGRNRALHTPFPVKIGPQKGNDKKCADRPVRQYIRRPCAHRSPTTKAQPAVFPDPNNGHFTLLHGLQPSPIASMAMETPGVAMALVADYGPLRNTAIGPLMPEEHIRNEYQPVLKTRYQTHKTHPVPGSNTGNLLKYPGILKEKNDSFREKGS